MGSPPLAFQLSSQDAESIGGRVRKPARREARWRRRSQRQRKPPAQQSEEAQRVSQPSPEPPEARGQAKPALWSCAMTSRTNRHYEGENPKGKTRRSPCALQRRRQEALERYGAGEPIAVMGREMGCSKSWL